MPAKKACSAISTRQSFPTPANLGALYAERGQHGEAESEFRQPLAIDRGFVPASANLADLYRMRGDEKTAESTLRAALKINAKAASLHYALGLALARQGRMTESIAELGQAARLAPDYSRYAYTYGIAFHGSGKATDGIRVLANARQRFTGDVEILQALATMERDRGRRRAALDYAQKLARLLPEDEQATALLRELQR